MLTPSEVAKTGSLIAGCDSVTPRRHDTTASRAIPRWSSAPDRSTPWRRGVARSAAGACARCEWSRQGREASFYGHPPRGLQRGLDAAVTAVSPRRLVDWAGSTASVAAQEGRSRESRPARDARRGSLLLAPAMRVLDQSCRPRPHNRSTKKPDSATRARRGAATNVRACARRAPASPELESVASAVGMHPRGGQGEIPNTRVLGPEPSASASWATWPWYPREDSNFQPSDP